MVQGSQTSVSFTWFLLLCVHLSHYQQGILVAHTGFVCMKDSLFFIGSLISLTTGSSVSSGSTCLQRSPRRSLLQNVQIQTHNFIHAHLIIVNEHNSEKL